MMKLVWIFFLFTSVSYGQKYETRYTTQEALDSVFVLVEKEGDVLEKHYSYLYVDSLQKDVPVQIGNTKNQKADYIRQRADLNLIGQAAVRWTNKSLAEKDAVIKGMKRLALIHNYSLTALLLIEERPVFQKPDPAFRRIAALDSTITVAYKFANLTNLQDYLTLCVGNYS